MKIKFTLLGILFIALPTIIYSAMNKLYDLASIFTIIVIIYFIYYKKIKI